jgi:uncharacterized membrane protein
VRDLVPLFLFLHVVGALVAFGPTFAFPIIGALAAKEPQHRPFVARLNLRILTILVVPFALSMAVTGGLLIWSAEWPIGETRWLEIAIAVYVVAILLSLFVSLPNSRRIAEMVSAPPPGGPPRDQASADGGGSATAPAASAAPAAASAAPAAAPAAVAAPSGGPPTPAGPPPELLARVRRGQMLGYLQSVLLLVIIYMMVVKPGF